MMADNKKKCEWTGGNLLGVYCPYTDRKKALVKCRFPLYPQFCGYWKIHKRMATTEANQVVAGAT